MESKYATLVLLLALVLIIVYILMGNNPLGINFLEEDRPTFRIREDFISQIEDISNLDVKVEEMKFWPLNRIVLKNVRISRGEDLFFSAPEIKIYYNFLEMIKYPEKWISALTYIKMDRPRIIIKQDISDFDFKTVVSDNLHNTDNELWAGLSAIDIYFQQGLLSLTDGGQQVQLTSVTGFFNYKDNEKFDLEFETDLAIQGLQLDEYLQQEYLQQYDLTNLNLDNISLEKIALTLKYDNDQWQTNIQTDAFTPQLLTRTSLLQAINTHSQLNLNDVSGKVESFLTISGQGLSVETYQGRFNLKQGKALVKYGNYINSEEINDVSGKITVDSRTKKIAVNNFRFRFAENPYNFNGSLDYSEGAEPQIAGMLTSTGIKMSSTGIRVEQWPNLDMAGLAQIKLRLQGELFHPDVDLDLYLGTGRFKQESINYLKTNLRYRDGMIFVDFFDASLHDKTLISLTGLVDSKSYNYSFDIQANRIEVDKIRNYLQANNFDLSILENINGELNLDFLLTGTGIDIENLNLLGDLEIVANTGSYKQVNRIESKYWFSHKKLILDSGNIVLNKGNINFSGEMNLEDSSMNIRLAGKDVNLDVIDQYLQVELPPLIGDFDFSGDLTGVIETPCLNLKLTMSEGEFMDYKFSDLEAIINYNNNNIEVGRIRAKNNDTIITGSGMIALNPVYNRINANLTLNNLKYSFIDSNFGFNLPLDGSLTAEIELAGPLVKPVISGRLNSRETTVFWEENNYLLDQLQLDFNWQQGSSLQVDTLELIYNDTLITASGEINKEELDLQYDLNQLQLTQLPLEQSLQLSGVIKSSGKINGELTSPVISGKLTANQLVYAQKQLNYVSGEFRYYDGKLELENTQWQPGTGSYYISGNIQNLEENPFLDLKVETENGIIADLMNIVEIELPVKIEGYLQGQAEIGGPLTAPETHLDVSVYSKGTPDSLMTVQGKIGKQLNLKVEGNQVGLSKSLNLQGRNLIVSGKTSFDGKLSGAIDNFNLKLDTLVTNASVNQFNIDRIEGQIIVNSGDIVSLQQSFNLPDDSNLEVKGDILLKEEEILDLTFAINRVSLGLISGILTASDSLDGDASGQVRVAGSINDPQLGGRLSLRNGTLNLLPPYHVKDIKGTLHFAGQTINLEEFNGIYAREKIKASGEIRPFQSNDFWNLKLSGSNLPFNHGSFKGRFDADNARISGALYKPLISAKLLTHDFIVSMPFSWPIEENERDGDFSCEYDLMLYPGENVYFVNNNRIDVLIEEGSLHLTYEGEEFNLEGKLSSNQGSFDYYNNKFMLDSGEVMFDKFAGYIPRVHARASTVIDGIKIIVTVDGQADNMMTTFTSQPSLSEEKILNLLTSKGGLGQFVTGEEMDVFQIISQEFLRFFREKLQLGLIEDIEEKFQEIFELDRMEIDAYDLGWNQDINLYLGKRLSDKFYLEYSGRFTPEEREDEISFRYYLDDSLHLEGSWFGDDEYQFSIEKSIEF